MRRAPLLVLLGLLVGSDAQAEESKSCQDRLQVMQRRIEAVPRHMSLPASSVVQLLPEVPAGKTVVLPGPIVDVGGGQVAMDGAVAPLGKPQPVLDKLASLAEREQAAKASVTPAYLRLDANQLVAPARRLVCRIAKQRPVRVVVRDARRGAHVPYVFPPAPPKWQATLDRIDVMTDPVERAAALSKAMRVALGTCPDLRDAFTSLIREPAVVRMVQMSDRILVAATRCQCKGFDVDGLEAVLLRVLGSTAPPRAYLELEGGCDAWPKKKGLRGQDLAERLAGVE